MIAPVSQKPTPATPPNAKRPLIGIGVIILRKGKVLLGLRKGSHGAGTWSFPGGHLEFGESIEECAQREALEETGLRITGIRFGPFTNDLFPKEGTNEGRHYVTLFAIADCPSGKPEVREPDKTGRWEWFSWGKLPQPLFLPVRHLREQGYSPFR